VGGEKGGGGGGGGHKASVSDGYDRVTTQM